MKKPKLTMKHPSDVLAIVPYLLGYHPNDSLVVIVCRSQQLEFAARFDIGPDEDLEPLRYRIHQFAQPERSYLLVAYASERALADQLCAIVATWLGSDRVLEIIRTHEDRYWLFGDETPYSFQPTAGAMASSAIYHGLHALPSRADVVARVSGPADAALAERNFARAARRLQKREFTWRLCRTSELVDEGLRHDLGSAEYVELAALITDPELADRCLVAMSRSASEALMRLWWRVVEVAPISAAPAALALLGVAAWLFGDGTLQVCCLERGMRLNANHPTLGLLQHVNLAALPPAAWEELQLQLVTTEPVAT